MSIKHIKIFRDFTDRHLNGDWDQVNDRVIQMATGKDYLSAWYVGAATGFTERFMAGNKEERQDKNQSVFSHA